jgi:hypothetical protein
MTLNEYHAQNHCPGVVVKKEEEIRDTEVQSFWPPFVALVCRALNELASRWKAV